MWRLLKVEGNKIVFKDDKLVTNTTEYVYALDTFDARGCDNVQGIQEESIDIMDIDTDVFNYDIDVHPSDEELEYRWYQINQEGFT
ncbi:hypothetical protein Tco_1066737 [Tanacetum coccineum]|uniref:Uncharacterized protein n=1 Tax=Tanacetum coccineum TaxID=301880 RepID=A0ABQ5HCL5_9ASTR